ncbi:hypothetical protein JCM10908_001224 [Rhodotorula pacifica]|uniref:uncharacterized protein n=1 Tax=Rhodotorula pacifica TaxID=1495444 RepID=UPI0031748736
MSSDSMSAQPPTTPVQRVTIACLPEEAIDLICLLLARDPQVRSANRALLMLSRTSRQFRKPAQKALLYDPTRTLENQWWPKAALFLERILLQPKLGANIRRLDWLPSVHRRAGIDKIKPTDFSNWVLALAQNCPRLEAVSVLPDLEKAWPVELVNKPSVRHVSIRAIDPDPEVMGSYQPTKVQEFLHRCNLDKLDSLELPPMETSGNVRCIISRRPPAPPIRLPPLVLPELHLKLQDFQHSEQSTSVTEFFDLRNVRSVAFNIRYEQNFSLEILTLLPPDLKSFAIVPRVQRRVNIAWDDLLSIQCLLEAPPRFYIPVHRMPIFAQLTHLVLEFLSLLTEYLLIIVERSPNLQVLDFKDSIWCDCASDVAIWQSAQQQLKQLRYLRIGTLWFAPCRGAYELISDWADSLHDVGIEVEYTPSWVRCGMEQCACGRISYPENEACSVCDSEDGEERTEEEGWEDEDEDEDEEDERGGYDA